MPPIPPTLREKRRYIHFQVVSEADASESDVKHAAYNSIISFLGEYGSAKANPKFIEYDPKTRKGIVKCTHTELELVKAALALVSELNNKPACFRLLRVSGTLKTIRGRSAPRKK